MISPGLHVVDIFIDRQKFLWSGLCERKAKKQRKELQRPPEGVLSRLLLLEILPPSQMTKTLRKVLERRQISALPRIPERHSGSNLPRHTYSVRPGRVQVKLHIGDQTVNIQQPPQKA